MDECEQLLQLSNLAKSKSREGDRGDTAGHAILDVPKTSFLRSHTHLFCVRREVFTVARHGVMAFVSQS